MWVIGICISQVMDLWTLQLKWVSLAYELKLTRQQQYSLTDIKFIISPPS